MKPSTHDPRVVYVSSHRPVDNQNVIARRRSSSSLLRDISTPEFIAAVVVLGIVAFVVTQSLISWLSNASR